MARPTITTIRKQIGAIPSRLHGLVFGASIVERHAQLYGAFSSAQRWRDPQILRDGLDELWEEAAAGAAPERSTVELLARCSAATPDTDDAGSVLASCALNACTALSETLRYRTDAEPRRLLDVSTFALDTVDALLLGFGHVDPDHADVERLVQAHPLMEAERAAQGRTLRRLSNTAVPLGEAARDERRRAEQVGRVWREEAARPPAE